MNKILFLVLWFTPVLCIQAQGAIEVYADGHKFSSFQAYAESQKALAQHAKPATLNNQDEEYILKEAGQLGINVDFHKVKTFQINPKGLSDKTLHQFYVLCVEHGVVTALEDFYQNRGQTVFQIPRSISSEQLQEAIGQAVGSSKDPKLLISGQGKVRIMALTPDESGK